MRGVCVGARLSIDGDSRRIVRRAACTLRIIAPRWAGASYVCIVRLLTYCAVVRRAPIIGWMAGRVQHDLRLAVACLGWARTVILPLVVRCPSGVRSHWIRAQ